MKRTKKFLVGLLAALSVLSGALGLAACDEAESSSGAGEATEIEKVYAQYVVYAEAQGQTPLSYEEWLASIKGEKGDKGDTGAQGEKGDKGDTGATGEKGDKGDTGAQGEKGDKGDTGAQGEKGEVGPQGPQGEQGEVGPQGPQGEQGEVGPQGPQGEQGEVGPQGPQGEQGVGIEKVEYDENGDLKITFTDGTTQTIVMPDKHVHTFGEWTVFTAEETPCENRLFFRVCEECKEAEWKQGSYSDHDFTTVTTDPTCQAGGYDTKTCEICGKVETVNPTEKVDHVWATEYSFDNSYHWIDCETCDEFKDKQEHSVLSSGECSVCGELVGATEGIVYEVLSDGTAQVVMYEGTATRVRIAETYQGAPVTKITNEAFKNSNITSIVIPDSVTLIGNSAFYYCDRLTSVVIGDGVTSIGSNAFYECESLTNVVIGDNVTSIGYGAFVYCRSLTSIEIPDSVTSIGESAFYYCDGLTSIVIPDGVTSIGDYAFYNCDSLTSIVIPDSVTSIGNYAFYNCDNLTSIEIPDSVTSIGDYAFAYCDSLTSIEIPDSVTSIGDYAFSSCNSLTSIEIPDSVTSIGNFAFSDCSSLQFNEYGNAKYLGSKTNDYFALIETKSKNFSSYTIHSDTKIIADWAFEYCDSLTSIVIGDSIIYIGNYAFYNCSSLTSVEILDSVTSIGYDAFAQCSNLTSVTIGDSVISIGYGAFYECRSLTSVVIGDGVTSIDHGVFSSCNSLTSVYYKGTAEDWMNIVIGDNNIRLTSAKRYYYSENEPQLNAEETAYDGDYWHYNENGEITVWVYTKNEEN